MENSNIKKSAEMLILLRERKGWTQEELGKCLGIGKQMVSHWETARHPINPRYFEKIKKLLDVSNKEFHTLDYRNLGFHEEQEKLGTSQNIIKNEDYTFLHILDKLHPMIKSEILIILSEFASSYNHALSDKTVLTIDEMKQENLRLAFLILHSRNPDLEGMLKNIIDESNKKATDSKVG